MTPALLVFTFFAIALVLILFELALPTHGVLGLLAGVCVAIAIGICFTINKWVGVGALAGTVFSSPILFAGAIALWQRSPVGRRVVLSDVSPPLVGAVLQPGIVGVAVSELRPMGECEFNGLRVQAASEIGIIRPGQTVRIIEISNGLARVRPAAA